MKPTKPGIYRWSTSAHGGMSGTVQVRTFGNNFEVYSMDNRCARGFLGSSQWDGLEWELVTEDWGTHSRAVAEAGNKGKE